MTNVNALMRHLVCGIGAVTLTAACSAPASPDDQDEEDLELGEVEQHAATTCTVSLTATPASVVYGDPISITATASCPSGTPAVQFYRNAQIIQPFGTSTSMTFDSSNGIVGTNTFSALVKRNGVTESPASSNSVPVTIVDNVPQCTAVKMVQPANNSSGIAGQPITLQAQGTCPAGSTPEYSFYVKKSTDSNWVQLPAYTLTTMQFTPPSDAIWQVNGVVRTIGAHTAWQVRSSAIQINVAPPPVNHDPLIQPDTASTLQATPVTINVLANDSDIDGQPLHVIGAGNGANGTSTFTAADVTYTPAPGFAGSDQFTYFACDDHGGCASNVVTVTVSTQSPTAQDDVASTLSQTPVQISVLANDSDPDGDGLAVTASGPGSNGSTSHDGTTVTYTPNAGFVGSDSFTYTISDGHGGSAGATVTVSVADQGPFATADSATTGMNQPVVVNVLANDSDPDGGTLSITAVGNGAHGSASTNGATVTYTPANGFVGSDSFSYTITDGQGGSASSTVSVTVQPLGPGCTISLSALETQVNWGEQVHLTATASCNTGAAQIEWWHAFPNSGLRLVQAFGSSASFVMTMNDPLLQIGANKFFARARTQGTTTPIATSNTVSITVVDLVPSCTAVALTAPSNGSSSTLGSPITLSATSTCPAGVTGEYLYFVKRSTDANWTEIPGHVPGSLQFTPPTAAIWQFQATVRSVGSHTRYHARSAARSVTVN